MRRSLNLWAVRIGLYCATIVVGLLAGWACVLIVSVAVDLFHDPARALTGLPSLATLLLAGTLVIAPYVFFISLWTALPAMVVVRRGGLRSRWRVAVIGAVLVFLPVLLFVFVSAQSLSALGVALAVAPAGAVAALFHRAMTLRFDPPEPVRRI